MNDAFLRGGNWDRGCGDFMNWSTLDKAVVLSYKLDIEGLPDRWLKIVMGQTNWIPKIVFESDECKWIIDDPPREITDEQRKRGIEWYELHKSEFG